MRNGDPCATAQKAPGVGWGWPDIFTFSRDAPFSSHYSSRLYYSLIYSRYTQKGKIENVLCTIMVSPEFQFVTLIYTCPVAANSLSSLILFGVRKMIKPSLVKTAKPVAWNRTTQLSNIYR